MKSTAAVVSCILLIFSGTLRLTAQAVSSATAQRTTITVGGTASVFQTDYQGDQSTPTQSDPYFYPLAHSSDTPLFGVGAYVDVKITRWAQFEAEARWQRFNQLDDIHQDNYLIGPRIPIHTWGKATVYGKGLIGFSNMTFNSLGDHGRFTTAAFGGGVDLKLTRKLSFRALDAEYQYWPTWVNSSLSPYGVSMGFGYRVF